MTVGDILVLAEHDNQTLSSATGSTVNAAKKLPGNITLLIAGYQCADLARKAAQLQGVNKVLLVDAELYQHGLAENIAKLMQDVCTPLDKFQYILAPATSFAKNILPRVAALLDVSQISDVMEIISNDCFLRPAYAGNVLMTVQSFDPIKVLTIRPTAFEANLTSIQEPAAVIETIKPSEDLKLSSFVQQEAQTKTRPELSSAKIVISGGRGLQSKENFKLLEDIADILKAAIGASRAAVDAGFVPNEYQVGQTGKVVAPELYIAVGISGAIQHLAGMKDSKVIVAINKDPEAAILQVSDYYLIGDLFKILPELKQELQNLNI